MRFCVSFVAVVLLCGMVSGQTPHRWMHEIDLRDGDFEGNPYLERVVQVAFTRPDGSTATVDGFYDGAGVFKARCYCDMVGWWQWRSRSTHKGLDGESGKFKVVRSDLPGKLRKHPDDPHQFSYDSGEWFLHIGDTGYRYVVATEPQWRQYIDQATKMGATKIRTWVCQGRSDVQVLFTGNRTELNLEYIKEVDRRLQYALQHHPRVQFQLIPFGEDTEELRRYEAGDPMSRAMVRYMQARFSALPNVHWCISNDREIVQDGNLSGREVYARTISAIAEQMQKAEAWGTLLTNHQSRWSGYVFTDEPWSDIVTLEDIDQVTGAKILEYRAKSNDPVVNDEDRYEHWRNPEHDRYFFRRLMWASLLSGGHATYGGLRTYEPYDGELRGVQGYYDAVKAGKLEHGADDFVHVHAFFRDADLTLAGMAPDDAAVGGDPLRYKCIRGKGAWIIYLANPDREKPERAAVSSDVPAVHAAVGPGQYAVQWFNPRTGDWTAGGAVDGGKRTFRAPGGRDWVLLLRRQ